MTWMLIRLVLSLAFVGLVLWFAARVAKKRGLGGGGNQGLIEVVARQRIGRSSSVNVVRIGDVVLVVGATEEQITLLAEVDNETIDPSAAPAAPARVPARAPAPVHEPRYAADDYEPGYDAPAYDGHRYEGPAEAPAYDGGGYAEEAHAAAGYGAGYDDRRGQDGRRPAGQHSGGHHGSGHHAAEGPRHSGAVRRPAVGPQPTNGPLAGSVFDKNGWGTFVNELRERTVRRP